MYLLHLGNRHFLRPLLSSYHTSYLVSVYLKWLLGLVLGDPENKKQNFVFIISEADALS